MVDRRADPGRTRFWNENPSIYRHLSSLFTSLSFTDGEVHRHECWLNPAGECNVESLLYHLFLRKLGTFVERDLRLSLLAASVWFGPHCFAMAAGH